MLEINNLEEFIEKKTENNFSAFYFSHHDCNVCKVLLPKFKELMAKEFSDIKTYYVNTKKNPEIAAQNMIYTVPVIGVFFQGREYLLYSRHISLNKLKNELKRLKELGVND